MRAMWCVYFLVQLFEFTLERGWTLRTRLSKQLRVSVMMLITGGVARGGCGGYLDGEGEEQKLFPALSVLVWVGAAASLHSPSSRLVQRAWSCRSLSKAWLEIFYVQDVGFLRTTLIIYLFHFSCVIVPIFYTKVLGLRSDSCCFIVALSGFEFCCFFCFERQSSLFLKSPSLI